MSVILISMLIAIPRQALSISGDDLVNYMLESEKLTVNDPNFLSAGIYYGYLYAAADVFRDTGAICTRNNVTRGQLVAVVTKYLKANPGKWDNSAISLVFTALTDAFPCKK